MPKIAPLETETNDVMTEKPRKRGMAIMSCCCSEKEESNMKGCNDAIDHWLEQEGRVYRLTHRLLLLGAGESGKSTIVKQMQIINMKGFTQEERESYIPLIHGNIREAMASMLGAMKTIKPSINFTSQEHLEAATRVLDSYTENEHPYTEDFFLDCKLLWSTEEVQACFQRSNEYHLIDSASYFLQRIDLIRSEFYLPDDQDILRCRVMTTQILDIRFKVKEAMFHMFDMGGQIDERRKWIQCFNDATAIVFVVSLSGYNLSLREDNKKNRMQESIDLFEQIWENRFLKGVSIILFLNKYDIFLEKIKNEKFKIENYFPNYAYYNPVVSKNDRKQSMMPCIDHGEETYETTRAKFFFRDTFMALTQTNQNHSVSHVTTDFPASQTPEQQQQQQQQSRLSQPKVRHRKASVQSRSCYPHFTCAVDTNHMRKIFDDCKAMIQRMHLERYGILSLDR